MKTILVTGGGGFIGSNLVAALLARRSHRIVVCDMFGAGDKWRNLVKHSVYEIITPDAMFAWLDANRQHLDMIFHLGAISSTTELDIDMMLEHNTTLSIKLWRWCNANTVRLLYASSSATYGDGAAGFDDNVDLAYMRTVKPMSCYGWSKHLFDMHVAACVAQKEVQAPQWAGIKFFNTYGPNEYHKEDQKSVISKIAPHAIAGNSVKLFRSYNKTYADGGQKRDVIYVKDAVRVMLWFFDNPSVSGLFNLGTGQASTFNDMAAAIFAALNKKANIHYIDVPAELVHKYQYFTEAKVDRLRAAGYTDPFTPLAEGIKDYVQNYLMQPDPYL